MNLQIIKSITGSDEYVLLPISIYSLLKEKIIERLNEESDYVDFNPADYVSNPIALARIQANLTQSQLAILLDVTQAYISKIENQKHVSVKLLNKVHQVLAATRKNQC